MKRLRNLFIWLRDPRPEHERKAAKNALRPVVLEWWGK